MNSGRKEFYRLCIAGLTKHDTDAVLGEFMSGEDIKELRFLLPDTDDFEDLKEDQTCLLIFTKSGCTITCNVDKMEVAVSGLK